MGVVIKESHSIDPRKDSSSYPSSPGNRRLELVDDDRLVRRFSVPLLIDERMIVLKLSYISELVY